MCWYLDAEGLGMAWSRASLGPTTVLDVADDGGWSIRILHPVAHAIDADALHWGRWKQEAPWLAVSRLKIEPSPLQALLRHRLTAFARPLVLSLEPVGLSKFARCKRGLFRISRFHWHLAHHPKGGAHSGIDRNTLRSIAEDAGGLPPCRWSGLRQDSRARLTAGKNKVAGTFWQNTRGFMADYFEIDF